MILLNQSLVVRGDSPKANQAVDLRCGAYCLMASLGALDLNPPSFEDLEKQLGQPTNMGYSLQQLAEAAKTFHASTLGVQTTLDQLERRSGRFACIAFLEESNHFICIYDIDEKNVYVVDPPDTRAVSREAFSKMWQGKALLISDRPISPTLPYQFPHKIIIGTSLLLVLFIFLTLYFKSRWIHD